MSSNLTFSITVKADAKSVHDALTSPAVLEEWFCDAAETIARPSGYFFAAWNKGYQAAGSFVTLEANKITLKLRGEDESSAGLVDITLTENNGSTQVDVSHQNASEKWNLIWSRGLENLQSHAETGYDLRVTRRPMLGIMPTELNDEWIAKTGVPVKQGIMLNSVLPEMGAANAGLQTNDVIVELDGHPITDYISLPNAVGDHQAGDVVDVVFYRGAQKQNIKLTFSQRRVEPIPATAEEYANNLEATYAELNSELGKILDSASEAELTRRPEAKEWSVKECIAHLVASQHWILLMINTYISNDEITEYRANTMQVVEAIASTYDSTAAMFEEYKRARRETVTLVRSLPAELVAKRGRFSHMIDNMSWVDNHDRTHFEQMRKALEAVRVPEMAVGD